MEYTGAREWIDPDDGMKDKEGGKPTKEKPKPKRSIDICVRILEVGTR